MIKLISTLLLLPLLAFGQVSTNPAVSGVGNVTSSGTTGSGAVVLATSPTFVTPVLGAATATSLTISSGAITPSYPAGIVGSTSGSSPAAGSIGEYLTATGSNVALSNTTSTNIASKNVTAGNYLVFGLVTFNNPSSETASGLFAGISTTSATLPTNYTGLQYASTAEQDLAVKPAYVSLNASGTLYLVAQANYTGTHMTGTAIIEAIRLP